MFKTQPQTGVTAEVSLVDHRVKEATALLPPDPTYGVPIISKVPLLDAPDQHGPLFYLHNPLHQKPSPITSLAEAHV